jgi:hypothetical protein
MRVSSDSGNPDAHGRSEAQIAAAGVMVGLSITALASSIFGFKNVGECRRALEAQTRGP